MVMSDAWFDEYVYEVAISRDYLPEDLAAVLREEPTILPPWIRWVPWLWLADTRKFEGSSSYGDHGSDCSAEKHPQVQ